MSPPNERSRPAGNGPANESLDNNFRVTPTGNVTTRDILLAEIMALGPDALYPASLGWRLGLLDCEEREKQRIGRAGADLAGSPEWHAVRRQPRWTELQRARGECPKRHRLADCTCPTGRPA